MAAQHKDWTREGQSLACHGYGKILFGQIHTHNPRVIGLARLPGRSVGSASLILSNFARLDPALSAHNNVAQASRRQSPKHAPGRCLNPSARPRFGPGRLRYAGGRAGLLPLRRDRGEGRGENSPKLGNSRFEPLNRVRSAEHRLGSLWHSRRLAETVLGAPDSWEVSNYATHSRFGGRAHGGRAQAPRNGLCLNALHDRAFDRHLMWIEDDYVIRFSSQLGEAAGANNETIRWMTGFDGARLLLPCRAVAQQRPAKKFAPVPEFLKRHAEKCLTRQDCMN